MEGLSYIAMLLLSLYREFFGEEYPADAGAMDAHVRMQNMCYILQTAGIYVGDFCFSWNSHHDQSETKAYEETDNSDS